jgi:hypothetical protein
MDPDLNKYDLNHRVTHHPAMSDQDWEEAVEAAWHAYYTPDHFRTVLRRAAAVRHGRPRTKMRLMLWFYLMYVIEGVHPLEGGVVRRKYRRDRRPTMKIENPFVFYPKLAAEVAGKIFKYARGLHFGMKITREVLKDPNHKKYMDLAITPPKEDELEALAMYNDTAGGTAAVAKKHREDESRAKLAKATTSKTTEIQEAAAD